MILVSACLIGQCVRYKGDACPQEILLRPEVREHLLPICPECAGGLATPRPPAEIQGANDGSGVLSGKARVSNNRGQDVTAAYRAGAQAALKLAKAHHITCAILKELSPSCGTHAIYDGSFSGRTLAGQGVAAAALAQAGIALYSEEELTPELLRKLLQASEANAL